MSKNRKKILITGGSGFIGSHLCKALVQENHQVFVIDIQNPTDERFIGGVEYLIQDIRNTKLLNQALKQDFDHVVHLAAIASVQQCTDDPMGSYETNVLAGQRLVESTKKLRKIPQLIFASSSAIYGSQGNSQKPLTETLQPQPLSNYGSQKSILEETLTQNAQQSNLPFVSFRFFNIYGESQDPNSPYSGVISRFIKKLKTNEPLTIYGDGNQTRDFIYVGDVIRAIVLAMNQHQTLDYRSLSPMNVGRSESTSIVELAQCLKGLTKSQASIDHQKKREGDIDHSLSNTDLIQKTLDWNSKVDLQSGLKRLV